MRLLTNTAATAATAATATATATAPAGRQGQQHASGWRVLLMLALVFASYFAVVNLTGRAPAVPTAHAYFVCCKWGGQPAPHTCCGTFYIYYEGSIDTYGEYTNMENGRLGWTNDQNALVTLFQTASASSLHAAAYKNANDSQDGFTSYQFGGGIIASATVWINDYWVHGYGANKAQGLVSHELGHAMGLAHNDTSNVCAQVPLMRSNEYRYVTCGIYRPTADDENGVNSLY